MNEEEVVPPDHHGRKRSQMQRARIGDYSGVRYDIQSLEDDFEIYKIPSRIFAMINPLAIQLSTLRQ